MIVHKNTITRVVISKVTWRTFQAKLEIIKKCTPKKFLIFQKMELSDSKIKKFRYTGKVGPSTQDRKVGP